MNIIWSPKALENISDIANYIALDNPLAAIDWANSIFEATERLYKHPNSGRELPELNRKDIQEIIKGKYRIIYKIKTDSIDVLLVRRGNQVIEENEFVEV